jgi:hypothetical protein
MPELRPGFFTFLGYQRRLAQRGTGTSSLRGRSDQERFARMTDANRVRRRYVLACAGALLALGLAGCGTLSDEVAGKAMVSPGRYDVYSCANIETRLKEVRDRRVELEQLMARSSQTAGGDFVNAIAYRSEYVQTGGDLEVLARTSAEKKCAVDSKFSSRRTVY